jgi:hypothetical protein
MTRTEQPILNWRYEVTNFKVDVHHSRSFSLYNQRPQSHNEKRTRAQEVVSERRHGVKVVDPSDAHGGASLTSVKNMNSTA